MTSLSLSVIILSWTIAFTNAEPLDVPSLGNSGLNRFRRSYESSNRKDTREIGLFNAKANEIDIDAKYFPYEDEVIYLEEEDGAIRAIQRVYEGLSARMKSLQIQLQNVEKQATNVLDRLTLIDCYDLKLQQPLAMSGVYSFHLDYKGKRPVKIACDMLTDGGGWTVIQQRLPRKYNDTKSHTNFNRGFYDYKLGFGNPEEDYWVGLENIYLWTNTRHYELRIQLTDFRGVPGYALYRRFHVDDESYAYRLHVSEYSGDVGDALGMEGKLDNFTSDGMMFSTFDEDRDTSHEINCSSFWNIGGWWFNRCSWANLNGPYKFSDEGDGIGINWHNWRKKQYMKATKMMIRPSKTP